MSWYSFFKYALVRPFVKVAYRPHVEGEQNIPATGGLVLAGNHTSAVEAYMIPAMIRRQVTYPAKAELFKGRKGVKGIPSRVVAWGVKAVGQVPLDRSGGRTSMEGLAPVLEVVRKGGVAGIFPEGTRSPDGRLFKGKTGVARLALAADAPVVPMAVIGAEKAGKLFGFIPMVKSPIIRFGRPLDFHRYAGCQDDRATVRWVTDEIMNEIRVLSGQEYVDAYATSVKYGGLTLAEADARVAPRPGGGPAPEPCEQG